MRSDGRVGKWAQTCVVCRWIDVFVQTSTFALQIDSDDVFACFCRWLHWTDSFIQTSRYAFELEAEELWPVLNEEDKKKKNKWGTTKNLRSRPKHGSREETAQSSKWLRKVEVIKKNTKNKKCPKRQPSIVLYSRKVGPGGGAEHIYIYTLQHTG